MADEKDLKDQQDITAEKEKQVKKTKEQTAETDKLTKAAESFLGLNKQTTAELEAQHQRYLTLGDSMDAQILQQQSLLEYEKSRIKDLEKEVALGGEEGALALEKLKVAKANLAVQEETLLKLTNSTEAIKEGIEAAKGLGKAMGGVLGAYGKHSVLNTDNLKNVAKAFQGGAAGAIEFAKSLGWSLVTSFVNSLIQLAIQVDEAESAFKRTAGASDKMAKQMTANYEATRLYGVELKEMSAAMTALKSTYTDFTMLNSAAQDEIAKTGALLAEVGIKNEDFAKSMQTSTKAFGLTGPAAAAAGRDIADFANVIGVIPSELGADFAAMGDGLAKMGSEGIRAFKDLAIVSKTTGLEMKKILAITDKFDTFEGAAEQAGKLNAALGGNFVNAMDLMMATDPAERFGMIRDSILDTGLTFDNMSYYQRKFYTDALGLSDVSDLAAVLSGDMSNLEGATQKSSDEYKELAKRTKDIQSMTEQFKTLMADLIPVMSDVVKELQAWTKEIAGNPKKMKDIQDGLRAFADAMVTIGKVIISATEYWYLFVGAWIVWKALNVSGAIGETTGKLIDFAKGLFTTTEATEALNDASEESESASESLAEGIKNVGEAATDSWKGILALGGAILLIGAGIAIAAVGLSYLVTAFADVGDNAPWAALGIFLVLAAVVAMVYILATMAPAGAAAAAGLMPLGFAILMIGAGVAIAALGIGEMAKGLAVMFKAIELEKMIGFAVFIGTLAYLSPGLVIAAIALSILTTAMFGLALALALAPTDVLENYATFFSSLAEFEVSKLAKIALGFGKINDEIEKLPTTKAIALTATMGAAALAGATAGTKATAAAVRGAVEGGPAHDRGGARGEVNVNVEGIVMMDGKKVGKFVDERFGKLAGNAMAARGV